MSYSFPISLSPTNQPRVSRFGRIGTTTWSLQPTWSSGQLTGVSIARSNANGTVDIELHFHPVFTGIDYYDDSFQCPTTIFKATFLQKEISRIVPIKKCYVNKHLLGIIVISSHCKTDHTNVVSPTSSSDPSKLSDDFLRLLDNPSSFADATLKCGTAEIPVHKCVLSVRSPVLAAMFTSQMQEGLNSTLLITDIKLDVLQATLKYIYSGKTDNLSDVLAGDLLFAADKYQLDNLKSICIAKLKSSMEVGNVIRILVLGELHDKGLKAHAMDYLCQLERFSDLEETEEWQSLEEEYPRLAMEVTKFIVKFLQQTK